MANQQNITLVRRLFDEVYTKANLNALSEILDNNVRINDPAVEHKEGLKNIRDLEAGYIKAFPNKKLKIDDIFSSDDKVAVRWTCQGVHKGELKDIAPTNKNFKITGISIYTISNGKITQIDQNWDRLGLLEQLGEIQREEALHL